MVKDISYVSNNTNQNSSQRRSSIGSD